MCALSLVKTPYEQHRGYVLRVLGRRCGWLDAADREAIFHDAYALLLEKQRDGELDPDGMHPHQVRAYLVQTALFKCLDESKRAERKRAQPIGDELLASPDAAPPLEDVLGASFEGARVREIVDELPARRQAIVKMRFFLDRAPAEIQELLGIRERVYRRELERAMRQLAERYELVRDGTFCDSRRSLVMAHVAGIAGPNRAREAQAHLDTCPGCKHWAMQLRDAARQVAGALPLPVLADGGGLMTRTVDGLTALKDQLIGVATSIKQHAVAASARVDASTVGYSSAARPGTVAAAVAGCLALGGGATYCAVEGLPDPVRALIARGQSAQAHQEERPAERRRAEQRPRVERTVDDAPPATVAASQPTRERSAKPRSGATPAPRAVEREFGLEGSGTPVRQAGDGNAAAATAVQAPPAPPPAPAPVPAGPPGEFDP